MKDKISIIVPIYNVEKYLKKCIDSIINQTYKNIEIILVDDGSTDSSGKIADDYQRLDERIVVEHIENSGVSKARNVGISIAKGQYIGFVDSDDYIESDMFEKLYESISINNSDLAIGNIVFEKENGDYLQEYHYIDGIISKIEYAKAIFEIKSIYGYTCNKLYSKKIITNNNINFNENITVLEDDLFNIEIISKNSKLIISYIDDILYHYVKHDSSVSNGQFNIKKLDYFCVRIAEINYLNKCGYDANYLKVDYCAAFLRARILIKKNKIIKDNIYYNSLQYYKKYRKEINFNNLNFKLKCKYLIIKFFPFAYNIKIMVKKK